MEVRTQCKQEQWCTTLLLRSAATKRSTERTCGQQLSLHCWQVCYLGSRTSSCVSSPAKTPLSEPQTSVPSQLPFPKRQLTRTAKSTGTQKEATWSHYCWPQNLTCSHFCSTPLKTGKTPKAKTYSENWSLSISHYRKQQTSWQEARQVSNKNTPIIALLVFLWTFIKTNTFKKYFSFD